MGRTKCRFRVKGLLEGAGIWRPELMDDLPNKWERHGDLVIVAQKFFKSDIWKTLDDDMWKSICKLLQAKRVARCTGPINPHDGFRTPSVEFIYNPEDDNFVTKRENGILYKWDATKCMFSSGNITEKMRIATFKCEGQAVVDMFAGIGYFTLPYLVHAKADRVYAIEWNPVAVEALRENLLLNKVQDGRCVILEGDCTKICPLGVADHVNLGLIPSSEIAWLAAVQALNRNRGGVLHVHMNVDVPSEEECWEEAFKPVFEDKMGNCIRRWKNNVARDIDKIVRTVFGKDWEATPGKVEKVKSYGPRVDHMVVDITVSRLVPFDNNAMDIAVQP